MSLTRFKKFSLKDKHLAEELAGEVKVEKKEKKEKKVTKKKK